MASEVPLRCVEACVELVAVAESLAGRSNVNAASDLNVAALLGEAAARGAAANVLINLPSIGNAEVGRRDDRAGRSSCSHDVERYAAETRENVARNEPREPIAPQVEA